MAILVTGASGFVGQAIVRQLAQENRQVIAVTRAPCVWPAGVTSRIVPGLEKMMAADWQPLLEGADVVIHAAAIAHATSRIDPGLYDAINHRASANLAATAQALGLRRMVFLSSIRAMAGPSWAGVITEQTAPAPTDGYGASKRAAEQAIIESGIEYTILRPVVIVGAGALGNVGRMVRLAALTVPLPLQSFENRRSLVSLRDVAHHAIAAIDAPALGRRTVILADPDPLTLPEMVRHMRAGMGRKAGVFSLPQPILRLAASLAGMGENWGAIAGDAIARSEFLPSAGLAPHYSVRQALEDMGRSAAG